MWCVVGWALGYGFLSGIGRGSFGRGVKEWGGLDPVIGIVGIRLR